MTRYIVRRVAVSVLMLTATSLVIFILLRVIPGDPVLTKLGANSGVSAKTVAAIRKELDSTNRC